MNTRKGRAAGGFTVVELMVVLIIIGIILVMALPSLARSNRGRQVEAAADEMSAHAQMARQLSIASGIPRRLVLRTDENRYWMERMVNDSTWTQDGDTYAPAPNVGWTYTIGTDPEINSVTFQADGTILATDAPTTVRFSGAAGDTFRLSLVRTGRVTVVRGGH